MDNIRLTALQHPGVVCVYDVWMKKRDRKLCLPEVVVEILPRGQDPDETGLTGIQLAGTVGLDFCAWLDEAFESVARNHVGIAGASFGKSRMAFFSAEGL